MADELRNAKKPIVPEEVVPATAQQKAPTRRRTKKATGLTSAEIKIVAELARHHGIGGDENHTPHTLAEIHTITRVSKSTISGFLKKYFRERDNDGKPCDDYKPYEAYERRCKDGWHQVGEVLRKLTEAARPELPTDNIDAKVKPERLIRNHREHAAALDSAIDNA